MATQTSTTAAIPASTGGASRMVWVDNVRTFMIILVVNMHACVTYSHVGGWFIKLPPEPALAVKIPFLFWQGHLQAFFMGLLFFIAGYFAERSIARKGKGHFLRDRLVRLGAPTLFFMLVIWPLTVWGIQREDDVHGISRILELYQHFVLSGRFISSSGPLWFAFALLIFSVIFAVVRREGVAESSKPSPGGLRVLLFCAFLTVSSFFVRLAHPLETNVLNFQLSFFSQYVFGFWVGVLSARHRWLSSLAD
jgi:glucan biosynthesis protein C